MNDPFEPARKLAESITLHNDPLRLLEEGGVVDDWVELAKVQYGVNRTRQAIKIRYERDIAILQKRVNDPEIGHLFQKSLDERLVALEYINLGMKFKLPDSFSDYEVPAQEGA